METDKAGGEKSVKDKMKGEVVEEEEEEEEDEDDVGLGSGEDDKKKKEYSKKGSSRGGSTLPSCQVDNCTTDYDLCQAVPPPTQVAVVAGLRQRFCQQCSRFHELSEFDETKRSCRRRLIGHNERRRKSSHDTHGEGSS
ncbi:hypothetical protein HYC85_017875 [Camellia sinensis]|uniref:SBP-type domain-containing protein n=1 Tax=Camellia sinensis TaxID=4442 RepID=A0A7J7GWL1_CAMSI|nr:hypothetical protein HYC85_017875 [Camellia sinensis]